MINGETFSDPCFSTSGTGYLDGSAAISGNSSGNKGPWNDPPGQKTIITSPRTFSAAQAAFQNDAKALAKKKFGKNCEKDFTAVGVTDSQVQAGASSAVFINGNGSNVTMSSLYATSPVPSVRQAGSTVTGTVDAFIFSHPGTVAVAQLGGPDIYLNAALINPTDYYTDIATVLHELLHNVSGLTDPDIQNDLGLPTVDKNGNPISSDNITKKLLKDCF